MTAFGLLYINFGTLQQTAKTFANELFMLLLYITSYLYLVFNLPKLLYINIFMKINIIVVVILYINVCTYTVYPHGFITVTCYLQITHYTVEHRIRNIRVTLYAGFDLSDQHNLSQSVEAVGRYGKLVRATW